MSYLRNVIVLIKKSWKSSALKERTNTFTIFPLKISLSEIPCFLNKKLLNALTLQSGLWWCNRPRVRSGDSIDVLAGSHEPDPRRPVNSDVHWTVQGSHFQYEYFVGNPLEKFEFSEFMKCGRLYLASSLSSEILLRRMYSRGWICFLKIFFPNTMNSGILHHDDVELIDDQSEMLSRWPFLQTEDIQVVVLSENTFFLKFHLFLWVVLSLC